MAVRQHDCTSTNFCRERELQYRKDHAHEERNGDKVDCTHTHRPLRREGSHHQLGNLKPNVSHDEIVHNATQAALTRVARGSSQAPVNIEYAHSRATAKEAYVAHVYLRAAVLAFGVCHVEHHRHAT